MILLIIRFDYQLNTCSKIKLISLSILACVILKYLANDLIAFEFQTRTYF